MSHCKCYFTVVVLQISCAHNIIIIIFVNLQLNELICTTRILLTVLRLIFVKQRELVFFTWLLHAIECNCYQNYIFEIFLKKRYCEYILSNLQVLDNLLNLVGLNILAIILTSEFIKL